MSLQAIPRLDLTVLRKETIDQSSKCLPFHSNSLAIDDIGAQDWNLLSGDLPMPQAVLRESVMRSNSRWMSEFARQSGLKLAPHGKTTMAPQLFDLQIADGAWAITVATSQQLNVCRRFGVHRILIANQPVGRQEQANCFEALRDEGLELYCLADSVEGVAALGWAAQKCPPPSGNPLRILVELGYPGGRTGARTKSEALAAAKAVGSFPGLQLAGFECFEGQLPSTTEVDHLLDLLIETAVKAQEENLFDPATPIILSAGGSNFFDRVGEKLTAVQLGKPVEKVLRSGCYLTHDSIGYAHAFQRIRAETSLPMPEGGLEAALEVWAYVQSRPEPGRAILTVGKRDISHDMGLPVPLRWYRTDGSMAEPVAIPEQHQVAALNDQHCHLIIPADSPLRVGDMVAFGIGHPCTTFDKWSVLLTIDDNYTVTGAVRTFF